MFFTNIAMNGTATAPLRAPRPIPLNVAMPEPTPATLENTQMAGYTSSASTYHFQDCLNLGLHRPGALTCLVTRATTTSTNGVVSQISEPSESTEFGCPRSSLTPAPIHPLANVTIVIPINQFMTRPPQSIECEHLTRISLYDISSRYIDVTQEVPLISWHT